MIKRSPPLRGGLANSATESRTTSWLLIDVLNKRLKPGGIIVGDGFQVAQIGGIGALWHIARYAHTVGDRFLLQTNGAFAQKGRLQDLGRHYS